MCAHGCWVDTAHFLRLQARADEGSKNHIGYIRIVSRSRGGGGTVCEPESGAEDGLASIGQPSGPCGPPAIALVWQRRGLLTGVVAPTGSLLRRLET